MILANQVTTWATTAALLLAVGTAGANAALIDDFNTAGLGEYTFSKVLDQGDGTTNVSFSDAAGTIDVMSAGSSGAEQVLLLRGDVLEQGREIQLSAPTTFNNRDFGLAIGQSHADLGDGVAGDNRGTADYAFMAWRSLSQLNSRGFIGGGEIGLGQDFGVNAETLFIARLANDDIEMGWYDGGTRNVSRTITPTTLDIFSNIGFYADVRGDGEGFAGADNLANVPEPASVALVCLSMVGIAAVRRWK